MADITSAVVLAAGEGSRLRPLTQYQPKPMLPVANRPIIDYVLDALVNAGISEIVVVVGHQHTRIQDHLMQRYPQLDLTYVQQRYQLGSGDALVQAQEYVPGEFVVVNGDNVVDEVTVRGTVDRYRRSEAVAAVAVGQSDRANEYGTVCTENGRVTTILERPTDDESGRINVGVYVFDERIFEALDRTAIQSGELSLTDAIPYLSGRVSPASSDGVWYDPAYPWDLLATSERLQSAHPDLVSGLEGRDGIDETARIHETATVEGRVLVGPGCEISAGAVLRNGVCLQSDVRVGSNSVVERSLLGADTHVGANVVLRDTVVGAEARIGPATVSPGGPADFVVDGQIHRNRALGSLVSDRAEIGSNVALAPGSRVGPNVQVPHGNTVTPTLSERTEVAR